MTCSADPGGGIPRRKLRNPVRCPHLLQLREKDVLRYQLSSPVPHYRNTIKPCSDVLLFAKKKKEKGMSCLTCV